MKAPLHPEPDLKGATPETLARALLRPHHVGKPIFRRKIAVKKVPPNKARRRQEQDFAKVQEGALAQVDHTPDTSSQVKHLKSVLTKEKARLAQA